ncbi:transmembrane protein, putative (macronuclear) [Tetrahymena thermophila SB210]|uniref:Transmembrane protein, putative n=1 Tax=Tetrahymena thermophila (strain SB210) TaxID=312017 RepID=I7LW99_TETTS|nr:transmembrane protein, putative [Tetrahymena thermophila SB210]EAS01225.1 transmembrane protein, putative [Tetrahymena thermophila SB210]|eukprot:XP_001021470.1 transmembrane protein, putative [Tetrahymena thermophila SB210]
MDNSKNTGFSMDFKWTIPIHFTIPATIVAIGTFSALFSKKCYFIHSLGCLRQNLKNSVNLKQLSSLQKKDKSLVYVSGQVQQNSACTAVTDPMFGVSSKINSLGLYRKLEIKKQINDRQYEWLNINTCDIIPNEISKLSSCVITNSDIKVENLTLAQPLLIELAEKNSTQIDINASNIDEYFEEIYKQFLAFKNKQYSQENLANKNTNYENHPFTYGIQNYKDIFYENNYIYIRGMDKKDFIRISFYDIQNIANVSLIAFKDNNTLTQFKIQELLTDKNYVKVMNHEGQYVYKNISLISFIEKGIIEHKEMIQKIFFRTSQNSISIALLYAFAIYIFYQLLCEQIGPVLDYENWSEEGINKLVKKSVNIENNVIQVSQLTHFTTKYVLLSSLLHIPSVYLYSKGSSYYLLFGLPLISFWLMALNRKIVYQKKVDEEISILQKYQEKFNQSQQNQLVAGNNIFDQIEFTKK